MPRIVWYGACPWDTDFPESPLPGNAQKIKRPDNIFISSLPYGIIPLILCYGVIAIKWFVLGQQAVHPLFMPLGLVLGFLLIPVHEVLHAVGYGKDNTVYIGISPEKFAAFAVCHEAVSRGRYVVSSLMPVLLGVIPLLIFLLAPANALISGLCIPAGIMGMLTPMSDYMDVRLVCAQTPKGAYIQTQNDGCYWFAAR